MADLWHRIDVAFDAELAVAKLTVQEFLKCRHPAWNLVGRVHFNLAENRKDEDTPFAFLATYTARLSIEAKAQHLPLGKALQEYSGARNRERLLSLLVPVQRAAEQCPWLKAMVDTGEIYHPLRWSPAQALAFLKDVPALEGAGVVVRMPASWSKNCPAHPQVKVTVGGKTPSQVGMDALLDFQMEVTLDGETLSKAEMKRLLAQSEGLAFIRGKWVEVISSASFVDPRGLAFDTSGDLWICDATGGELFEFAAASLGASGSLTPTVTITATPVETIDGITTSLDGPDGLAFDPSGNLWVSNLQSDNAGSVAEFTAAQLATSGNPSPAVFLDSDEFGLNIHQPALLTFGPILREVRTIWHSAGVKSQSLS